MGCVLSTSQRSITKAPAIGSSRGIATLRLNIGCTEASRAAERLEHALGCLWRPRIVNEPFLVLVRSRENRQQFLEQRKVAALDRRFECLFHAMVARNEGRTDAPHSLSAGLRSTAVMRQP